MIYSQEKVVEYDFFKYSTKCTMLTLKSNAVTSTAF